MFGELYLRLYFFQFSRNLRGKQDGHCSTPGGQRSTNSTTAGDGRSSEAQKSNLNSATSTANQSSLFDNEDSEDDDILKLDKKKRKRGRIVMEPSDFPSPPQGPPASFSEPLCPDQPAPPLEQGQGSEPALQRPNPPSVLASAASAFLSSSLSPSHETGVLFSFYLAAYKRNTSANHSHVQCRLARLSLFSLSSSS